MGPEAEEGRRLNISPDSLRRLIAWLKRRGWQIVLPKDAALFAPRTACLTFDDGFVSTCTHGAEVMDAEGVKGAIYVVSGCAGGLDDWEGGSRRPLAGWADLRGLQARGHEIGCHTDRHPFLGRLDAASQEASILGCRQRMEVEGLEAATFCYPYGSLDTATPGIVERAGFRLGWALGRRSPQPGDSPFALPRVVIAFGDGVPGAAYKIWVKPRLYRLLGKKTGP